MSDHYDARETRDPAQREAELLSALAGQVDSGMATSNSLAALELWLENRGQAPR